MAREALEAVWVSSSVILSGRFYLHSCEMVAICSRIKFCQEEEVKNMERLGIALCECLPRVPGTLGLIPSIAKINK